MRVCVLQVDGFREKNRDQVRDDLRDTLIQSQLQFVADLFSEKEDNTAKKAGGTCAHVCGCVGLWMCHVYVLMFMRLCFFLVFCLFALILLCLYNADLRFLIVLYFSLIHI